MRMRFISIKIQAMILLMAVTIIPIAIVGVIGTAYFQDVIKDNIWEDNLAQAKAISLMTANYIDSALLNLMGQTSRPSVVEAVSKENTAFINDTITHIQNTSTFDTIYVTDSTGTVISSYPADNVVGRDDSDKPWVSEVLKGNDKYVSDATTDIATRQPAIYIGSPIRRNNTTIGVMVGVIDLPYYADTIISTQVKNRQYTYLVNRTGHVMVHSNSTYAEAMHDMSAIPAVSEVINGKEGEIEYYDPIENKDKLAAFSPVAEYRWGVIVSLPVDVAYEPVTRAVTFFSAFIVVMIILSAVIASLIGRYVVDPITSITSAAGQMPYGKYQKALPMSRNDEIGGLARALDRMAKEIQTKQNELIGARNQAEEEKTAANLYLDIMGHDINNLNQMTLTSLELMENDRNLTPEQQSFIKKAISSTRGSAGIIENVNKIQQISTEELHVEGVDIDDLIVRCIQESPHPAEKKIEINYDRHPGMIVTCTPLLKEVFCNLINNSIKYSGPEVTIDITATGIIDKEIKYYQITIADNGHGIPDVIKPRLFRRFERGTTKAHGKGLGLYIVRMLVERFGGTVEVTDRVPGDYSKGTTFIVRLPAA